jgi:SHS2 domain-containing protein
MAYKFIEHTADLKIQVREKNIEDAFISSALALKEAICGKIKIKNNIKKEIKVSGKDYERLLYEFLEQFLYLLDAEGFLINEVKNLKIEEKVSESGYFELRADAYGDFAGNYKFTNDVKAITYNEMLVSEDNRGEVVIQFVVDV